MTDREKVILGIENCLTTDSVTECRKTECPFITCRESCLEWLLRSALSLLKAQEPRVMTLTEIEDALDTVVWVEEPQCENFADHYGLIEAYAHKAGFVHIAFGFSDPPVSDNYYYSNYGKAWRCWTSRPTDEQREAVKWDE